MEASLALIYSAAFFGIFSSLFYLLTLFENRKQIKNPIPNKLLKTTIIVPAFNEEGRIKKTVESLLNQNYPKHLIEVILVDDGSTDNTLQEMKEFASERIKVLTKKNGGKASALNMGIKQAQGEIIVSLDADSFVGRNSLRRMMGHFNNPDVMAVTPSMKIWKPKSILQKIQFVEYLFGIFLRKAASILGCVHVTPGPFSAYRKLFFEKHGAYRHAHGTEDIEMALRIQSHNYKIANAPDAHSYTLGPSGFMPLFRQRLRWYVGFIRNVIDYKKMFFSAKYGTLGLFYLPTAFLSVFFSIMLVGYMFRTMYIDLFNDFLNLKAINFDFIKLIDFNFDFFYFSPSLVTTFVIAGLVLAVGVMMVARIVSRDKESIIWPFLLSMFLYAPLYALWWLASFAHTASGKEIKWNGISWKKD